MVLDSERSPNAHLNKKFKITRNLTTGDSDQTETSLTPYLLWFESALQHYIIKKCQDKKKKWNYEIVTNSKLTLIP